MTKANILLGLGNLYVESNYLDLETSGSNTLEAGKEYSSPKYEVHLGGSAVNFITQAKRLKLEVGIIGKSGNDEASKTLFRLLDEENISTDLIKKSDSVQTNVDTGILLSHSAQNIQFVSGSANQSLSLEDIDFENPIFDKVSGIYFGGGFKQKLLWPKYPQIFKQLHERGIALFLDAGRVPIDADQEWIDILKEILPFTTSYFPNDMELLGVTGADNIDNGINKVLSWGVKTLVVKKGPEGCIVTTKDEKYVVPGFKVDAVNTVGAGDCFNASFISQILKGKDIKESAKFANGAAAFRVSENRQPTYEEVEIFLKNR